MRESFGNFAEIEEDEGYNLEREKIFREMTVHKMVIIMRHKTFLCGIDNAQNMQRQRGIFIFPIALKTHVPTQSVHETWIN